VQNLRERDREDSDLRVERMAIERNLKEGTFGNECCAGLYPSALRE
jgi:hypothetical protein